MSLIITLKDGTGAMFAADSTNPNGPKLEGFIELLLEDGKKDGPKLRLPIAAWTKEKDGKPYYSVAVGGGLHGAMFPETEKRNDDSPDYTGSVGPNRELRLAGWKRRAESDGQPYISLLVSEPSRKQGGAPKENAGREARFI